MGGQTIGALSPIEFSCWVFQQHNLAFSICTHTHTHPHTHANHNRKKSRIISVGFLKALSLVLCFHLYIGHLSICLPYLSLSLAILLSWLTWLVNGGLISTFPSLQPPISKLHLYDVSLVWSFFLLCSYSLLLGLDTQPLIANWPTWL